MLKKQNIDPNRSTRFTYNNKSLYNNNPNNNDMTNTTYEKILHNKSLHTISQANNNHINHNKSHGAGNSNKMQTRNQNINSKILAQFKKQQILTSSKTRNNSALIKSRQKEMPSQSYTFLQNPGAKTNLSTTRSNYKPKFILKDLMANQQNQSQKQKQYLFQKARSIDHKNDTHQQSQSICEQYFERNNNRNAYHKKNNQNGTKKNKYPQKQNPYLSEQLSQEDFDNGNVSNTFTNSPLGEESYYFCNFKKNGIDNRRNSQINGNNKSAVLTKRTYVEQDTRKTEELGRENKSVQKGFNKGKSRQNEYRNQSQQLLLSTKKQIENIRKNKELKNLKTQQQEFYQSDSRGENYDQGSTIEYYGNMKKSYNMKNSTNQNYRQQQQQRIFPKQHEQTRIRSISQVSKRQKSHIPPTHQQNFKIPYLQTKKQLQIRTAYFNEAIQLCKHVIQNMKDALTEECQQSQGQNERLLWVRQRCIDLLSTFNSYDSGKN